jgi:UDP-glucose 4-epimerase
MRSLEKKYTGKKVLVTGGAGFVGSTLADRLSNDGAKVCVVDNLSSGRQDNISNPNIEFVNGDIRNADLMDSLVQQSDIVFHLAEYIPETKTYGAGHVIKYSVENPLIDFDVSCVGSLTVLDKCRKYDKAIVFTSSAAVYGENKTKLSEESPTIPSSPYGASKLCAETYMVLYAKLYNLPVTVLRFCNLYGPKQRKYILYDILLKIAKNPKKLEILGTGSEERDFIYVTDAIDAVLLTFNDEYSANIIFNVGTGTPVSIKTMTDVILKALKLTPELSFTQSSWKGDIKKLWASTEKIQKGGFKPSITLQEGVKETIKWFIKAHNLDWTVDPFTY